MFRKPVTQEELQELNLTPFLDVMIVLIPFLMLSVSFTAVVAVKASLPVPVVSPKDAIFPPPFDLVAQVTPDTIKLYLNSRTPGEAPTFTLATPGEEGYSDEQLKAFHSKLVEIKKQHPAEQRLALDAAPSVPMERIAQLMDQTRTQMTGDAITGTNGTDLFPNVALKGVYVP
ncbi:MAG: biopolymer transporter ExbD [Fibrobacterota bacterium]|nr:biopolymer transporter ExbD [Fibrobacterota bacterium]QQS06329.1 MAG: biopolymer transporter ExbD [Fibrobacterota bacterium]